MISDVGKFIRLRATCKGVLEDAPDSARGLVDTYNGLRAQMMDVLDGELKEEFQSLHKGMSPTIDSGRSIAIASEARARIASLTGWLDGVIQEAEREQRMKLEAEAYARERVKSERGVGFQGS